MSSENNSLGLDNQKLIDALKRMKPKVETTKEWRQLIAVLREGGLLSIGMLRVLLD
jgi:hypothetical protein